MARLPPSHDPLRCSGLARITRVMWTGDDGRRIVRMTLADGDEEVTGIGTLDHLDQGEIVAIDGRWEADSEWGKQVRVVSAKPALTELTQAPLAVVALTAHVGRRRAAALAERHPDLVAAIDADPFGIFLSTGMSAAQAEEAAAEWHDRAVRRELVLLLEPRGLSGLIDPLLKTFGGEAYEQVANDPLILAERYDVPVERCEQLAEATGAAVTNARRGEAAIVLALRAASHAGDSALVREAAVEGARRFAEGASSAAVDRLIERGALVPFGPRLLQLRLLARQEEELATIIARLAAAPPVVSAGESSDHLTEDQRRAFESILSHRLVVVTGGPGTGKTTLIGDVVRAVGAAGGQVRLCAPTGKAAQRLEEATNRAATTVHSLARFAPLERDEPHDVLADGDDRLAAITPPRGVDLLVCDEASMLTVELALALLRCVGERTHVVLVGDPDQLPPIAAGAVLEDAISSEAVTVCRLRAVMRQGADSQIPAAARAVLAGTRPSEPEHDERRDFYIAEQPTKRDAIERVVHSAGGRMARTLGVDPIWDVQVLAGTNDDVATLNERLQQVLNPGPEIYAGFRRGDKLLNTYNDSEHGLVNGSLVRFDGRDGAFLRLTREIDRTQVAVPLRHARRLRLAYALTVHKAQGSEFPGVIVLLAGRHPRLLTREWLYTAITRAERGCLVVAQPETFAETLQSRTARMRTTTLAARLRAQVPTAADRVAAAQTPRRGSLAKLLRLLRPR